MPVQKRNEKGMTGYNALWDKQSAKDTAEHVKSRVDNYTDLVNGMLPSSHASKSTSANIQGYYDGATELYEYGWADSFHFCRFYKGEAFLQAVRSPPNRAHVQLLIKPACTTGTLPRCSDQHPTWYEGP
jgi:sterol 24-C-methyltransferase